jgi:hypothetical protein
MGTLRGSAAQDAMFRLAKVDWSAGKPTPVTTAPFNLQADRYIYTEKGGWMDMSHLCSMQVQHININKKKQRHKV